MPLSSEDFHTLYDAAAQPVLLVQAGQISACSAAVPPSVAPGRALRTLLPDGQTLPDSFEAVPCRFSVCLPEGVCAANTQPLDGCVLVFLSLPQEAAGAAALERAALAVNLPLSSITAAASALTPLLTGVEDPAQRRSLSEISRAYYQLLRLSSDLSEFSRVLRSGLRISAEKDDLGAFLAEVCMHADSLCAAAGRTLQYELPAAPVPAWFDRRLIRRAVLALLSNAVKFSAPGSTIRLTLTRMHQRACIRVTDTGDGMDAHTLAGAFRRAAESPTPGDARIGAGFSLPLVEAIAQAHGGSLLLQSTPQQGTDVCLTLPLGQPKDASLLKSPFVHVDRTGGFPAELVGLADVLPPECFDLRGLL